MEPIEVIGFIASTPTIYKQLSKLFLPLGSIPSDLEIFYDARSSVIKYSAEFRLPEPKFTLHKYKYPRIQLESDNGFIDLLVKLDHESDYHEMPVKELYYSPLAYPGKRKLKKYAGEKMGIKVSIYSSLDHLILKEHISVKENEMRSNITNTLAMSIRNYELKNTIPNGKRVRNALLFKNGSPTRIPLSVISTRKIYTIETLNYDDSGEIIIDKDARLREGDTVAVIIPELEPKESIYVDIQLDE